jgi:hypothetical protein
LLIIRTGVYAHGKRDSLCIHEEKLARGGFKHHTSVGMGSMKSVLEEAFTTYLGYNLVSID